MTFEHSVPKNILTVIGDMTVSFAALEFNMQVILVVLINQSARIGSILASQLNFSRLRASIISLYKERYGEDDQFQRLQRLMATAAKIEIERNLITHSFWGMGDTPGFIKRTKMTAREKRGFHIEFKEYNEQHLTAFVESIRELTDDVLDFYADMVSNKN